MWELSRRQKLLILYYLKLEMVANTPVIKSSGNRPPLTAADYFYEKGQCYIILPGEEKVNLETVIMLLRQIPLLGQKKYC